MASKQSNKRSIVMDEIQTGRNSSRAKYANNRRTEGKAKENEMVDLDTLLQQQYLKEKELLKQWKEVREKKKKILSIMRSQSRDISDKEKRQFANRYAADDHGYTNDLHIWKHEGCNSECKKDNCMWWKLEAGMFS